MTLRQPQDETLDVRVEGGRLVISIGISCLGYAIENADFECAPKVTDPETFAREMVYVLGSESENGSTPVHRMLDAAALEAIENGAAGVDLDGGT